MWWWSLWSPAALAANCDPDVAVLRGLQAWLAGDVTTTGTALEEAAGAWGCSAIAEPQTLARYWILDGAVLAASGDREESNGSFAAARRVAPEVWLQDLGPELHATWDRATGLEGTGTLVVEPAPDPSLVWIDGARSTTNELSAGAHLVQIGVAGQPDAAFATVVWIDPGVSVLVRPVLPVRVPEPVPVAVVDMPSRRLPLPQPPPPPSIWLELQGLVGASSAVGGAVTTGELREPQVKVAVPLLVGVGVANGFGFARLEVGGAVLVSGRYLATDGDGDTIARATRVDLGAAAGLGDQLRVGVAGGMQWPSRVAGRALVGWSPIGPLVAELRLGANLTTAREAEPAGELLVGVRL